ncbi:cell division protein ZapA [Novosphingobium sp. 1949]|uniref:Cell division protein ZapA n=1 Tax=Novosphingobium organovorum TaxID=2930092 RepID=A0ABT0B9D0_9SPHN|nr:cell division protein ZapA [Novosphingobium organovorum]MCJ2181633.1 cell division protein ZapA [Novosphingobium organovorum]
MNNVPLSIGGREFLVGCAAGEEDHLLLLGRRIEEKIAAAGVRGLSETRMLLFAALLLADENDEMRRAAAAQKPDEPELALASPPPEDAQTDAALERIALRMEKLAALLENATDSL